MRSCNYLPLRVGVDGGYLHRSHIEVAVTERPHAVGAWLQGLVVVPPLQVCAHHLANINVAIEDDFVGFPMINFLMVAGKKLNRHA